MGGHHGVADGVAAVDLVRNGRGYDEEVVHRAIAGGGGWSVDDATHLSEPAGGRELLRSAVPVPSEDPRADQPGEGEGDGVQEVEVALGLDPPPLPFMLNR